jgi:hypothetical protein
MLPGEMGLSNAYSAVGNSVWFPTNKARCFRSANRGQTWEVAAVPTGVNQDLGVCFSTEQKGALWASGANTDQLLVTNDGGVTWDSVSFPDGYYIQDMSRVPGWEGGFVITAYKTTGIRVYFTPDMFSTLLVLEPSIMSNGAVEFYDVATGWLGGGESGTNQIFKFIWVLHSGGEQAGQPQLTILPNPSSGQAIVRLPSGPDSREMEIRITDMAGKTVGRYPLQNGDFCNLDASMLANGVYVVVLYDGNSILARERWVVSH